MTPSLQRTPVIAVAEETIDWRFAFQSGSHPDISARAPARVKAGPHRAAATSASLLPRFIRIIRTEATGAGGKVQDIS